MFSQIRILIMSVYLLLRFHTIHKLLHSSCSVHVARNSVKSRTNLYNQLVQLGRGTSVYNSLRKIVAKLVCQ
jgi:hypothetical protein